MLPLISAIALSIILMAAAEFYVAILLINLVLFFVMLDVTDFSVWFIIYELSIFTGLSALTLESRSYRRVYAFLVMFGAGCCASMGIYLMLNLSRNSAGILWCIALLGTFVILVKTPSFPFSLWLPEAHVEASWPGSVVLAAFALKFATLASALFALQHLVRQDGISAILFFSVGLSAYAIAAAVDIKKLVANFSILHMSATLLFLGSSPYAEFYPNFSWHHHSIVTGIFFVLVGFAYASSGSRLVRLFLSNRDSVPLILLCLLGLFTVSLDLPWTSNVFVELQLMKILQHTGISVAFLFIIFWAAFIIFLQLASAKLSAARRDLPIETGATFILSISIVALLGYGNYRLLADISKNCLRI